MNYSISEENYLKTIYHLQEEESTVSTNAVAAQLNTKAASVTDMMKKLSAKGLLNYSPIMVFRLARKEKRRHYLSSAAIAYGNIFFRKN